MKQLAFFSLLLLTISAHAQSLATSHVGSAGQELKATTGTIHFNIGEVAIADHGDIREGLIQVFDLSTLVNTPLESAQVLIYPNPSNGQFTIQQSGDLISDWVLSDQHGRMIMQISVEDMDQNIHLDQIPAGQYYLIARSRKVARSAFPLQIIH